MNLHTNKKISLIPMNYMGDKTHLQIKRGFRVPFYIDKPFYELQKETFPVQKKRTRKAVPVVDKKMVRSKALKKKKIAANMSPSTHAAKKKKDPLSVLLVSLSPAGILFCSLTDQALTHHVVI